MEAVEGTVEIGVWDTFWDVQNKFYFSTRYPLPTWNQEMSFMPLIYSLIHVTIFPPMERLFCTLIKTKNNPQPSIRSDEGLMLKTSAFQIFRGDDNY